MGEFAPRSIKLWRLKENLIKGELDMARRDQMEGVERVRDILQSIDMKRKRMQQRGQNPQPTRNKYRFNVEIKYGIEYTPADERTK